MIVGGGRLVEAQREALLSFPVKRRSIMKKRMSIIMSVILAVGLTATACGAPDDAGRMTTETKAEAAVSEKLDEAVTGPAADATTGQAADVRYTKKVPYKTIRKKLKKKGTRSFDFKDVSSSKSTLTFWGFYYKAHRLPHVGYGDHAETIMLLPTITAKKKGGSSELSLGMTVRSIVQVRDSTARKYKKMIISGGREKFTLSGSSSTKRKTLGEFLRLLYTTTAKFTISRNTSVNDSRVEMLERILSSNNPKITIKDSAKKKTYKCGISSDSAETMLEIIKDYKRLLKTYKS